MFDADDLKSDLEYHLRWLTEYMCYQNRTGAFFGVSPVGQCITDIVNWIRAYDRGDYETASFQAWDGISIQAWILRQEWDNEVNRRDWTWERHELDGLSLLEFAIGIYHEWDIIQRNTIADVLAVALELEAVP